MNLQDLQYMKAEMARRANWREVKRVQKMIECHLLAEEQKKMKIKNGWFGNEK